MPLRLPPHAAAARHARNRCRHRRPAARRAAALPRVTPALASPLALVCHDAGALHLILPWLDLTTTTVRAHLQGPARDLWLQHIGTRNLVPTLDDALDGAALLLTGSSLHSPLEHQARLEATAAGLRSVAVIDHWIGYAARFQRDGHRVLPTEIWVCDAEAYALASACFPGQDILLQPNEAQRAQVGQLAPCPDPRRRPTVLLLPEPLDGAPDACEQGLDFLLAHADRLGLHEPLSLRLRPHESDPPGRWTRWIAASRAEGHDTVIDNAPGMAESIDRVAWVAGFESTALVLAHAAGRRAVCLQPPWQPRSRLPQRGLIHLRDLVTAGLPR